MIYRFLQRTLGLEKHETVAVAWSFAYFFCVLSSYYMLRPVRESVGVSSGTLTLPLLFTTTFIVMIAATSIFGWVASRYARRTFLPWVYGFFVANILLFYAAFEYAETAGLHVLWVGRVFFVWLSIFNLFVVSVFWSFMADIYTREQGRRLFGVISAGGSFGALLGPTASAQIAVPLGSISLLPLAALLLSLSMLCINRLKHWVERSPSSEVTETAATPTPLGGSAFAGISHVIRSRYFLAISLMSVFASLLGTALYMFMNSLVGEAISDFDERTRLFAYVDTATNAAAMIFQLLLVRHAVGRMGLGVTLALLPILSAAGFALLAVNPTLLVVAVFTVVRRAVGFGFAKPSSDMLYSVVTPEEKYKAKNFIDTAVYRGGDFVGTWVIRAMWGLGITGIAIALLPFALLWVLIALWLGREYRRRDHGGNPNAEAGTDDNNALGSA